MGITRRDFLIKTLQGTAAAAVPVILVSALLESCGSSITSPTGQASGLPVISGNELNGVLTLSIDSSSPLAQKGGAAIINSSKGKLLADRSSDTTFNVLSSVCTHEQCIIDSFDTSNSQFVCNCHGSHFDLNGQVTQGPARSALSKYSYEFANNVLTIRLV